MTTRHILTLKYSYIGTHNTQIVGDYDTEEMARDAVDKAIPILWGWHVTDDREAIGTMNNGMGLAIDWRIDEVETNKDVVLPEYILERLPKDFKKYMDDKKEYFKYLADWIQKHGE